MWAYSVEPKEILAVEEDVDIAASNFSLLKIEPRSKSEKAKKKTYANETGGNKSNSGVPGEGGVFLKRLFEGVTGGSIISLE